MKKIDVKKNLEERVQYTEWTAKNTWNVLDRIRSEKKGSRGVWVRRLAPVLAMVLLIAGVSVTGLWGGTGGPDTIREQYTAQPIVTALAAGQGEGIGDLEAEPAEKELAVSEKIQRDYPDLAPWLQPIGMSCEKDGIRLTLISGAVKGNESLIVYSLQDMEGKYAGKQLDGGIVDDIDTEHIQFGEEQNLYTDEKEHRYIGCSHNVYEEPVSTAPRTVQVQMKHFSVEQNVQLDPIKMLKKYGVTSEGVLSPENLPWYSAETLDEIPKGKVKVLDYTQPLNVPVLGDITLDGVGWIDGKFHAQFHNPNAHPISGPNGIYGETNWGVSLDYDMDYWTEDMLDWASWDENGDKAQEWSEEIINRTQEELEQMRMRIVVTVTDEFVGGDWEINFPLSMISDEACIEEIRAAEGSAAAEEKNYVVPRPEIYTRKAWPVTEDGYADLQANLSIYVENRQVYMVKGVVQEILSDKPLRVKINAGGDGESLPVVIERPANRKFDWQPGDNCEIYGEVIGGYDGMPLLLAGYTYTRYIPDVLKGVKNELKPIGLEVEKQGIRMTLDSGLVRGNEAWLVYSLEDLEEKYSGMDVWAMNFTSTLETVTEESDAEHPEIIHQTSSAERMIVSSIRKEDHTYWYVYWLKFPDEIDMTERTIKAGTENIKIESETIRDLDAILKEHGKTEEGITTRDYVRKAGQPAEIKVLDNAEPLNIPLGSEKALLTGIGWIDGKLHVQVQKKEPSEIYKGNNSYSPSVEVVVSGFALQDDGSVDSVRTNEMNGDCQPVQWTDFSTGSARRYEEWILDCKPDEPIKLMADVILLEDVLTGDWNVEFPLSKICAEE